MIELLKQKTATDTTSPTARALVTIDLGNGEVKAAVRMPGIAGWITTKFDSTVRVTKENEAGSIRLATPDGFKFYAVGETGSTSEGDRTGRTKEGKVTNARALLIEAVRQIIEPKHGATIHLDCIFTSPSNAAYRERIVSELLGNHSVMVPADETDLDGQDSYFAINVHNAFGQLEGLRAGHVIDDSIESDVYLFDLGHRTLLITRVNAKVAIAEKERYLFDDRGVAFIADEIARRELLAGLMCFSAADVIAVMFSREHKAIVQNAVADVLADVLPDMLSSLKEPKLPRYAFGGGASIPGVAKLLGAKALKDCQWASLYGLAEVADKIIASEQRRAK